MKYNEIKLKPCPFCGGKALIIDVEPTEEIYYIGVCLNIECGASIGIYSATREEAAEAWNRRSE